MKEKTCITLSRDVLTHIDKLAGTKASRSAFIEAVLRDYLKKRARAAIEARDLALINAHADKLNAAAEDVLEYQHLDWSDGVVESE
jgi:metal-responsive CopG/Arc/MetJ family transcriptional regulator